MQADIAPNSDSTMRYSQGSSSPVRTRSDSASTMWVCGEMGYAATTCGRHRATVRATAWDPSIWLGIDGSQLVPDVVVRRPCGGDVALADRPGEAGPDRTGHRL